MFTVEEKPNSKIKWKKRNRKHLGGTNGDICSGMLSFLY
jgi:hypothetical protein